MEYQQLPAYYTVGQEDEIQSPMRSDVYHPNAWVPPCRKPLPSRHQDNLDDSSTIPINEKQDPPAKTRKAPGWWDRTLFALDEWSVWETVGLLGSALTLTAMAIFLNKYDHSQAPTWKLVSLNTVIAWLSTIARLLVTIPLSSGIGQLKWTWLADTKKPLGDLAAFDSASRGAVGSFKLLWTIKGRLVI